MRKTLVAITFTLGLPVILVTLWWINTILSPNFFIPEPPELIAEFFGLWFGPRLWADVLPSLARFGMGVALAIVVGVLLGIVIGLNRTLRAMTEPLFEFFRALPAPVLVPPLLLIIGPNDAMKVVVIAIGAVWPVLLNTVEGVRATDPVQNDTSRSYGISGFNRVRYQVLPSAAPQVLAGVRQCLPIGLILMVISEMFAPTGGLGAAIIRFQRTYAIPEMWSGILLLGIVGFLVAMLFRVVERRILRWYYGLKDLENAV
ncbi:MULTISPECIES: ABC transporter permease [unclassified Microbacterium]|uniref:ABC transporter permease n=1 Tax=unclassified Microbacterium TaxID=2609290 RepID=UPI00214A9E23|nr:MULTISPECIES: ABC transporter permease [unclassified Microbacterium]MCR2783253.1 ABC transporter permease [Microbacterium sp. zg.B96]WIM15872.1 ABC transporter permease [Microbacterium sp. zg-B96]